MRALLDSHAFLWFILDDHRLSDRAGEFIRDPSNRLIVAQVLAESIPLVSVDLNLDAYGIVRIW